MDNNVMDYRNCDIRDTSYQTDNGLWVSQALVFVQAGGTMTERSLEPSTETFWTQQEASAHAFDRGRRFIDNKLAGQSHVH